MNTRLLAVLATAVAALLLFVPTALGQALMVNSSTDGKGLYTYTFSHGSAPYVWGLTDDGSAIYLQSYGVIQTTQPTNWTATIEPSGLIIWSITNGVTYLDAPVSVTVRSIFTSPRLYQAVDAPQAFIQGSIVGEVYSTTNHEPLGSGVENFAFIGPDPSALNISRTNNQVVIDWYSAVANAQLQSTTNLSNAGSWILVTNASVTSADRKYVTNFVSGNSRFYRLKF